MNLIERLGPIAPPKEALKSTMQVKSENSSNVLQNYSSHPSKQPLLLQTVQELIKERDDLKQEIENKEEELTELREQNSMLFSQISKLKQTVAEQAEEIVTLNESDEQLLEMRQLSERWMKEKLIILAQASKDRKEAEACRRDSIDAKYKAKCAEETANRRVSAWEHRLEKKELALKERETHIEKEVKLKASKKFNEICLYHSVPVYLAFGYGFFTTILYAFLSDSFRNEFIEFFVASGRGIKSLILWIWNTTGRIHWIIKAVIIVILCIITLIILYIALCFIVSYLDIFSDSITFGVLLFILAIIVYFSEYLSKLPINLILLGILSVITYFICRTFIQWEDIKAKSNGYP